MNGPDHYRAAERLLAGKPKTAADRERGILGDEPWPPSEMELRTAQVHATLALAAATALNDGNVRAPIKDCYAWVKACSVEPGSVAD